MACLREVRQLSFFWLVFAFVFERVFINDVSGCMLESFHSWLE